MKHKKGQVSETTVVLVILVISLALLLFFLGPLAAAALGIGGASTCSAEALKKDLDDSITDKLAGLFANTNIYLQNCKIDVTYLTQAKYPTEEKLDEFFADEAVQCYTQFKDLDVFPSEEKIAPLKRGQDKSGWVKARDWVLTGLTFGMIRGEETITRDGNGNVKVEYYATPPMYCAVCSKVYFDEDLRETYRYDDGLPMFDDALKNSNEDILSAYESNYEYLDQGRYKGKTELDTLERYSYDPTKVNAVVYYRRYGYDFKIADLDDWTSVVSTYKTKFVNWLGGEVNEIINSPNYESYVVKQVSRDKKESAIPKIQAAYKDEVADGIIGFFTLMTVQDKIGLYKWTSPFGSNIEDEYGVAVVPYEYIAHQCDFVANAYGKVKT